MPIFRNSIFNTECDECDRLFSVSSGGVCERCRRILCADHLHGSIGRRMLVAFGIRMVCVRCRAGETPAATSAP
ncbi:MAG: hypothetical protein ABIZ91_17290 [Gemmatimonadaceae bacterium]